MEFLIEQAPPEEEAILKEKEYVCGEIKRIKTRDTVISFIVIIVCSAIASGAVFWTTGNIKYSTITIIVFPVLGIILSFAGVTMNAGFRSAALRLVELNNTLVSLTTVSEINKDIEQLSSKYKEVEAYCNKVRELDREFVNGELAMFWEWDASTQAKTARARNFVEKAHEAIDSSE